MQSNGADSLPDLESQDIERIVHQLRRLKHVGFLRLPRPGEAQREYIQALASLDADLLELAVSRWIEQSTCRFFPFPGELRAQVRDELRLRASELFKPRRQQMIEDMRARGLTVIEASS